MNLIGIHGRIGNGKDTVGRIIQYLTTDRKEISYSGSYNSYVMDIGMGGNITSKWEIKKYSAKLKQIASLLTGIPAEKFEDQEFKKTFLNREWDYLVSKPGLRQDGWLGKGEKEIKQFDVRLFLQKLGTDAIRDGLHSETWVNALFADYYEASYDYKSCHWIITDTRFVNEAQAIKDRGGIVISVRREMPEAKYETLEKLHPSETDLDNWDFDWILDNRGTIDSLVERVKEMLVHYKIIEYGKIDTEKNKSQSV